ncbi:hypothetical protein FJY63_05020, partial [Candidatus Sumerlaeota bacterium]|nr:hypothetical protein [Candidatus Sumerlaeota bacterium]
AWNAWQTFLVCFAHPTNPAERLIYNHTRFETKEAAQRVAGWIEQKEAPAWAVAVQGESSWPLVWYFRRYGDVRFEPDTYRLSPFDRVVITDPGIAENAPAIRLDFSSRPFELRSSWVPPAVPFNEILCLRALAGEPPDLAARLRYRIYHSTRLLRPLGRYLLFRQAYTQLHSLALADIGKVWPGDGKNSVQVELADYDGKPIAQAVVAIWSSEHNTLAGRLVSGFDGRVVFALDDGTYAAVVFDGGEHSWAAAHVFAVPRPRPVQIKGGPAREEPFGAVVPLLCVRRRISPEPLMPPVE